MPLPSASAQVGEDQVGLRPGGHVRRLAHARSGPDDREAAGLEHRDKPTAKERLVVDDHDAHLRHASVIRRNWGSAEALGDHRDLIQRMRNRDIGLGDAYARLGHAEPGDEVVGDHRGEPLQEPYGPPWASSTTRSHTAA